MARCLYWAVPTLLAAIASGCGAPAERPSSAGAGAVVPWIDRPAPRYQAPAPRVVPYPTTSPPCRAGQLVVRQRRTGVGLGNVLERFAFRNLGATPCLLRASRALRAWPQAACAARCPRGARRTARISGRLLQPKSPRDGSACSTSPPPAAAGIRRAALSVIGHSSSRSRPAEGSCLRPSRPWSWPVVSWK
jgi:hypothetical protein